ncbi:hypothetical protein [Maribacter sp. 2-571]|uniref:hypothetical protein n=1 Tax=Maribacter sp. 2-571 TaxID=3417569 RepID=UPI003D325EC5
MRITFKYRTTEQHKKGTTLLLVMSLFALVLMLGILGFCFYGLETDDQNTPLIFMVPTVLGPLSIFPALIAALFQAEIKRRRE